MFVLLATHVPPVVVLERLQEPPTHTADGEGRLPMLLGTGLTVSSTEVLQPVLLSVNDMRDVPALTAVTMPVDVPMVATPGLVALQVPLPLALVSVVIP